MAVKENAAAVILCAGMIAGAVMPTPVRAADASFGCKVLLCLGATSSAYCVPVMAKLYRDLEHGEPWPICAEANQVGGLNHVPYENCPAGTQAGSMVRDSSKDGGGSSWVASANGNLCGRVTTTRGIGKDSVSTTSVSTTPRPTRDKPYNVVISNNGVQQTIWFAINP